MVTRRMTYKDLVKEQDDLRSKRWDAHQAKEQAREKRARSRSRRRHIKEARREARRNRSRCVSRSKLMKSQNPKDRYCITHGKRGEMGYVRRQLSKNQLREYDAQKVRDRRHRAGQRYREKCAARGFSEQQCRRRSFYFKKGIYQDPKEPFVEKNVEYKRSDFMRSHGKIVLVEKHKARKKRGLPRVF